MRTPWKSVLGTLLLLVLICCDTAKHKRGDHHARLKSAHEHAQTLGILQQHQHRRQGGQYTFISWNIANLGKSQGPEQVDFIARLLVSERPDIIVIQEVTAGKDFGIQAVARIVAAMNNLEDNAYDYIVSDPTEPASTGVERYGCIFYKNSTTLNRREAHLVPELREPIDREPFMIPFTMKNGSRIQIFTIHAVPTAKNPITEVRALTSASEVQEAQRAIVAGDFNLGPSDTDAPFQSIGFSGNVNELTSLKQKLGKDGAYRKYQYDNIYTKGIRVTGAEVIDFVSIGFAPVSEESLKAAHTISDHLPILIRFE